MMNDDESLQEQQRTSHISYKDYKKMLYKNKKQGLKLFLWAFFVLLLIFLGMAKMMSPDVDITLGEDENQQVEDNVSKGEVDGRLKDLQEEDDTSAIGSDSLSVEDGERVSIPKTNRPEDVENRLPEETLGQKAITDVVGGPSAQKTQTHSQQVQHQATQTTTSAPTPVQRTTVARVIVGNYPTPEQAEVAKSILQEAGLGVTPFVRKLNGAYTLQVATYGSKEKAMSVAESLLNQNFPAKVVVEYK